MDTFRSLRGRNFRLFFGGQFVSRTGTWMEMVAASWLVLRFTESGTAVGLVTAAQSLPVLIVGAWAGLLADRSDRLVLMRATQAAAACLAASQATLVVTGSYTLPVLVAFRVGFGLITALDSPTRRSLVNDLVAADDVTNAVGMSSAMMTGSRAIGPALAGMLISGAGVEWCFILNALSYVGVLAVLLRIDGSSVRQSPRAPRGRGQLSQGFAYVVRTRELLLPLVLVTVIGTLAFNYQVTLPLFARRSLGGDAGTYSLLLSAMGVGSLVGALLVARSQRLTITTLIQATLGLTASTAALAAAFNLVVATLAASAVGVCGVFIVAGSNALVQVHADPTMRGRVLALFSVVLLGSTPVGAPIIGWASEALSPRAGLAIGGLGGLLVASWASGYPQRWSRLATTRRGPSRRLAEDDPRISRLVVVEDEVPDGSGQMS